MASKTAADPTGQRTNRKLLTSRVSKRLDASRSSIIKLLAGIPRKRRTKVTINAETVVFDYEITPDQMQDIIEKIDSIISGNLGIESSRAPSDWWYKDSIELPHRQGTLEEIVQFNQLIAAAIAAGFLVRGMPPKRVQAEQVLMSQPYRQAIESVYVRNYTEIKSLGQRTSSQVMTRIQSGIQSGEAPSAIAKSISERFEVAKAKAKRIVNTEVNWAYNDARLSAVSIAERESGARAGVRHISALTSTTRDSHAERHGNIYTVEQQRQWWASDANMINCKCSTESVLVDAKGLAV